VKEECLQRIVPIGEHSVRYAVKIFLIHYHRERNHQGIGNNLVITNEDMKRKKGAIYRKERLGGLLNYYYRRAA
jgi:putative transposase